MTRIRGLIFKNYLGVFKCTKCNQIGYLEEWQSYLTSQYTCFSVKHTIKGKTVKRCWLFTTEELKIFQRDKTD